MYCRYTYIPNIGGPVWPVGSHYYEVILSESQLLTLYYKTVHYMYSNTYMYIHNLERRQNLPTDPCTKRHNINYETIGNELYSIEVRVSVCFNLTY